MTSPSGQVPEERVKVHVQESIGTMLLGIVCIMLAVFYWRSEERHRAFMREMLERR